MAAQISQSRQDNMAPCFMCAPPIEKEKRTAGYECAVGALLPSVDL